MVSVKLLASFRMLFLYCNLRSGMACIQIIKSFIFKVDFDSVLPAERCIQLRRYVFLSCFYDSVYILVAVNSPGMIIIELRILLR